jgi:hypothetical protein
MKINNIIILAISTFILTSCNDWLDVSPKSQIMEEDQFCREGGYRDELTGVYTVMESAKLYGKNLGYGFAEVLSHNYNIDANSTEWRYINSFDYHQSSVESTITSIWSNAYNAISNLNLVIKNIEKTDSTFFTGNNYWLCKGEAYGLRAFLHLDLMRLFAQTPATGADSQGVPYVTNYSTEVVAQKTVSETMQLIINDLLTARESLKHDSLYASKEMYDFRATRTPYFNYWAATLTLARAYLWNGDTQNALKYANEIINIVESKKRSTPFNWVHYTEMSSSNLNEINRLFTTELLFYMPINNWKDAANYYFMSAGGTNALTPGEETAKDIYELSAGYGNDYRYLKGYEQDGEKRFFDKFWYVDGSKINGIYPILRMTEAFYIAAECLKKENPARAIELLNAVRENRNLSAFPLSTDLNAEQIQNEIFKEYRKEFVGEGGQLFFYYKRTNASEIKGASVRPSKSIYVLPIPANDIEFGGYTN